MTKTFAASIAGFSDKVQRRATLVLRSAAQDVASQAQTVKGAGGRMPIDTGNLRASFTSILNGSALTGEDSYVATLGNAELGDHLRFEWRTDYAARMEFGFVGTDSRGRNFNQSGNLFASTAIANWANLVDKYARQAEAMD
jgi:hypothetical protein